MAFDIHALPRPQVIEELDFEAIFARKKTTLIGLFPPIEPVLQLESSTSVKLMQEGSYSEMTLRARVNDAARANLLAFARGSDLDHLAAFYDVVRMDGEGDERLAVRIILAIQGRSPGGTEARYKFIAMSADLRVQDAAIYTVGRSPIIYVAVFSTDNNGVADQILVDKVNAALQDVKVRMVNDTIVVAPAASSVKNIRANAWLLPSAPTSTISNMATALRSAWLAEMALGRDITKSWLISKLMIAGVQRVEIVLPESDIVVPFNQAAGLGAIIIENMGRDF